MPQWHLIDLQSYVNEGFAMNSLVYSAIMYKARAMMTAPMRAYTGDPDYPTRLNPKHSLSRLVAHPNEHQSWTEFQALNVVYLNVAGNVYIYKDRKRRELQALRPDRVFIVPTGNTVPARLHHFLYVPEGKSPVTYPDVETFPILPEDMIHIKLPYPLDPLEGMGYGMSPMSACAQVVDVDNMVTDFLNVFFKKGTMLTGILTFDIPLKEGVVDTILERWTKKYGGQGKWGTGVLDRGGKYERLGLTFEEMGFAEQDARNECRILGPFGVPPILISSRVGLERSTYSNYGEARKACWEDTLVPELKMFEVEYQRHLRARQAFVKFDTSQVPALQKDLPPIIGAAFTLWQMGVPANQALAAVGLRIGKVPGGDVPHISSSGRGQDQGPHVGDDEGWGMRALAGLVAKQLEAGNG
jgi:HK97 family phage portal protein